VDADRNMLECAPTDWGTGVVVHAKEQRIMSEGVYKNSVEHKYSYNAVQYKIPAYGWSSTKPRRRLVHQPDHRILERRRVQAGTGLPFGDNDNPDPIILDYWRGTHYGGGASCNIAAGENWSKVIGPIFVYVNSLSKFGRRLAGRSGHAGSHRWQPHIPAGLEGQRDGVVAGRAAPGQNGKSQWPYDWVNGVDYPHKDQRGTVTGQLVLDDPQAATTLLPHLTVGLAHPDYLRGTGGGRGGFGRGGRGGAFGGAARTRPRRIRRDHTTGLCSRRFWRRVRRGNPNVDWAHDASSTNSGTTEAKTANSPFTNVRPGTYTLHAFADGVLGEFARPTSPSRPARRWTWARSNGNPCVTASKSGRSAIPTAPAENSSRATARTIGSGAGALRYALLFPNDITYTIGKSDYHKDWFFEEVPHALSMAWVNPAAKDPANQRFGWVKAENNIQLTVPAGELTSGVVYDYLRLELNEDYIPPSTSPTPSN
jgi:rhamnogalacturonan endolyase